MLCHIVSEVIIPVLLSGHDYLSVITCLTICLVLYIYSFVLLRFFRQLLIFISPRIRIEDSINRVYPKLALCHNYYGKVHASNIISALF